MLKYISCNTPMVECSRGDVKDGVGWKCHTCKGRMSIRAGSFFSKSHLSKSHLTLQQWMMLIHYWSRQNSVCDAAESSGVGMNTAIDVYQWLREVCSTRLINDGPVRLGGPGVIVQIDESLFRHKQKVPVPVYHFTDTGTACITNYCNIDSIIMEDVPNRRCGYLGWWIRHIILPGGICKW